MQYLWEEKHKDQRHKAYWDRQQTRHSEFRLWRGMPRRNVEVAHNQGGYGQSHAAHADEHRGRQRCRDDPRQDWAHVCQKYWKGIQTAYFREKKFCGDTYQAERYANGHTK